MMKTIRDFFQSDEMAEARPFYLITTFALLITSALTLFSDPNPMPNTRLPLFAGLMVLHLAFHWLSSTVVTYGRWHIPYLLGQGILALALVLFSQRPELALTLFAAFPPSTT